MKPISIIVAIASNYAIGKDNDLLWHISDDLKRFKRITSGHPVVMGKNTFFSLPFRPLPKRRNIVLTDVAGEQIEGCEMAYSIEESIELMDANQENFIMGGGSIYYQFLPLAQKLYITQVHQDFEADVFFPKIDESVWKLTDKTYKDPEKEGSFSFSYEIWERK
ncbi:MAG: dihydrofolate reductase [Bacteroidales bacterium]|nr:dihydrofolate reductase [Bacteroidales bacterium]